MLLKLPLIRISTLILHRKVNHLNVFCVTIHVSTAIFLVSIWKHIRMKNLLSVRNKCQNDDVIRNHLKSHDIYACDKCNYRATSTRGLSNHMKTHKDKQLKCKKCDFTANTLNKLNAHLRTHTGDAITIEAIKSEKTPGSSNAVKRGLPVSPEIANTDKTSISNSNLNKKSKN